ncbi:cytochrome P450 [Halorarius litoreus]|uniref:cytochrome P450 n=1 Tax=Halorarius litoreus TaxID=2962676 RepID=UPI0020CED78B|nr:cytochrome P450 [Halorarius litoreus]
MGAHPPGPKGAPFIGNTHQYARDPFTFMTAVGRAYGGVARFQLADRETFMLTNPEDIEEVLVAGEKQFRKPVFGDDAVQELLGNGLLLSEGEFWRQQRKRAQPAFDPRRITSLADRMVEHTRSHIADWDDGDVVDIREEMAQLTVKIIVDAMFATTVDDDTTERIQAALEPLGARFEPDAVRFLTPNWVPTRENREFHDAVGTLEDVLDDIVAERRDGGVDDDAQDLLAIMLRATAANEIDDRVLRDELMTMLLAGHDTTALTLTYALYLLDENPAARDRLTSEVDDLLDGRPPTASDVHEMAFASRVLNEAMRLYPPVYVMFRQPRTDVKLGGYRVPEDALVMLPQWVVHRDPRFYDDPETFDPDRWAPERVRERPNYAFFPFGGGPRICIGKQFSLLEARLILGVLLQQFDLHRTSDAPLQLRPSLTMHPRDPVEMELRARYR